MQNAMAQTDMTGRAKEPGLILGIDTCGPSGSVALARAVGDGIEILGERELAGKSYSATLVAAVGELLDDLHAHFDQLNAIVIVNGPGSFTGVRVGVSAVKGLAEAMQIGIVAISRLEVLAGKACVEAAALDAHRTEVFLRVCGAEMLAGQQDLAELDSPPDRVAVCDDAVAALLQVAWPQAELIRCDPPSASDAIRQCATRITAATYLDLAQLDGHYLRRSDAEIFGETGVRAKHV
jgi:tRNA threonylcarbamoyladenosine biosynthesis protein TsaB